MTNTLVILKLSVDLPCPGFIRIRSLESCKEPHVRKKTGFPLSELSDNRLSFRAAVLTILNRIMQAITRIWIKNSFR